MTTLPLCFRCEHRARFHETGNGPKYECGDRGAIHSCYMYEPVAPMVMRRNDGDRRVSPGPWFLAARAHALSIAACKVRVVRRRAGWVQWKEPLKK